MLPRIKAFLTSTGAPMEFSQSQIKQKLVFLRSMMQKPALSLIISAFYFLILLDA
jgi:hypothetical protein